MKLLAIAIFVLSSSAALATPAVGDYAVFSGTVTKGTQVTTIRDEMELVSYDQTTNQFTEKITETTPAGTTSGSQQVDATKLLTDSTIAQILQTCASFGGVPASVTTAIATFNTCALPVDGNSKGTVWVGAVPFGIVQMDLTDVASGQRSQAIVTAARPFPR